MFIETKYRTRDYNHVCYLGYSILHQACAITSCVRYAYRYIRPKSAAGQSIKQKNEWYLFFIPNYVEQYKQKSYQCMF